MKFFCYILLFILPLSMEIFAQDVLTPVEHSGKWIEGNELYMSTIDSVKVKVNFAETTGDYWIFEVEFFNQSAIGDVLIDPNLIRYGITKTAKNKPCQVSTTKEEIKEANLLYNLKPIKKNTLEPKQSLFGHILLKRCKFAEEITFSIPIGDRKFVAAFDRK